MRTRCIPLLCLTLVSWSSASPAQSVIAALRPPTDASEGFASGRICISGNSRASQRMLSVEFADTQEQRARGLMNRTTLAPDAGMLFRYPQEQSASVGFWMQHVSFTLDIAFLDAQGRIVSVRTMTPCEGGKREPCPIYPAGAPFMAALEVRGGLLAAHGFGPGSVVAPCDAAIPTMAPGGGAP
jgi:uncharacterized membrane protein (UPF0127 family)